MRSHQLILLLDLLEPQLVVSDNVISRWAHFAEIAYSLLHLYFAFRRIEFFVDWRQLCTVTYIYFGGFDHILFAEFWYFDRESLVETLVLLSEVDILALELINLSLNLLDGLILLIHLNYRFVSDVHRSRCVVQSGKSFVEVQCWGASASDHQGFGIASRYSNIYPRESMRSIVSLESL